MQYQVEFNFFTDTQDYAIKATVTAGAKSINCQFDRFQEPGDDDTVEITSVIGEDGNEKGQLIFSYKELKEIEALAIEAAAEESVDETE